MASMPRWIRVVDEGRAPAGSGWVVTFRLARFWWLHPGAWRMVLRRTR